MSSVFTLFLYLLLFPPMFLPLHPKHVISYYLSFIVVTQTYMCIYNYTLLSPLSAAFLFRDDYLV